MKKFLYLASAAAFAFASCSDDLGLKTENGIDLKGKTIITAELNVGGEEEGGETRTSLNSSYQYLWSQGDALGLFGGLKEYNVDNADFYFAGSQPATSGKFAGQVSLLRNARYFAYYPWSEGTKIDYADVNAGSTSGPAKSTIEMNIRPTQNFNISNLNAWSDSRAMGSFSNNTAPSVGVGYAGADNQINFSMKPIASYLVFPITGNSSTPVQSIELAINNGEDYYDLAVSGVVNLTDLQTASTPNVTWGDAENGIVVESADEANNITLLCSGNGVDLSAYTHPINFWFVVPPGIELNGATITLTINGGYDNENGAVVTKTLGSQYSTTAANNVQWVWAGKELPFTFTPGQKNVYEISTAAQFIEYAYLVTKGVGAAVQGWASLNGSTELSDLPNMLTGAGEYNYNGVPSVAEADNYVVKNAVLGTTPLDLSQSVIANFCGVNLSNPTANDLANYYNNVYITGYLTNGLASIGGMADFVLGGADNNHVATIQNLVSYGPVFAPATVNASSSTTIKYLTLQSCTAKAKNSSGWNYFLITDATSPSNYQFTGVTVGAGCNVGGTTAGNTAIYPTVKNADISSWKVTNATPFSKYANTLNISANSVSGVGIQNNMAFDFRTAGMGVNNFANITIADGVYASGLIIGDPQDAENLVNTVSWTDQNANYAILEYNSSNKPVTSYWTGTVFKAPNGVAGVAGTVAYHTAESLAGLMQQGISGTINMQCNFNLMGTYTDAYENQAHKNWWFKTGNLPVITVNTNYNYTSANQITNVYMDDTYPNSSLVQTVLGYSSYVPNTLNISDVEVNISKNNHVIAAVSVIPGGNQPSNVNVDGFTLNIKNAYSFGPSTGNWAGQGGIGGLYQWLTQDNLYKVGDCSYTNGSITPSYSSLQGIVAGVFDWTVKTPVKMTIPYVGDEQAFGVVTVDVWAQSGASSFIQVLKANSETPDNWQTWQFNGLNSDGSTPTIPSELSETEVPMNAGYTLYVQDSTAQYLKRAVQKYEQVGSSSATQLVTDFPSSTPWSTVSPVVSAPSTYAPIN